LIFIDKKIQKTWIFITLSSVLEKMHKSQIESPNLELQL